MILYRAMSWQELSKYLSDITIRPLPGLPSKNTWKKNVLCFFGTANNAVHWAAPGTHDVIVKVDIPEHRLHKGWGIYPDLTQQVSVPDMLTAILTGRPHPCPCLKVKEYAVTYYDKASAFFLDYAEIDWRNPYKVNTFKNGQKIKVLPGYDDLIKE